MKNPIKTILRKQGFIMLDGALATELENRGANLDHHLWSAKILMDSPQLIREVSNDYLQAGADIISSASYQASFEGFEKEGLNQQQSTALMKLSIDLAVASRDAFWAAEPKDTVRVKPLVAASVGPYGACLHDGSEYSGNYGLSKNELMAFHRTRLPILSQSGADVLIFETIPSLLEAEALIELLQETPQTMALLSFSCKDERHVSHGESFAECVALAEESEQILAIGINCTAPRHLLPLLRSVGSVNKPLMVYPNSGEQWIAEGNCWSGSATDPMTVTDWYDAGAWIIGGCCRTTPADIRQMRKELTAHVEKGQLSR